MMLLLATYPLHVLEVNESNLFKLFALLYFRKRIRTMEGDNFGNSVFNIKPVSKENFPLFGAKYDFHLEGVVDCPEFLVHMPTMEK